MPAAAALVLIGAFAAPVRAQSGANITLQLPSFSTFGVDTTVLVPDSGASPLARQRQAAYARSMYGGGLFPQRAIGVQRAASGVNVTAQIHDLQAMDDDLLRQARSRRANWERGSTAATGQRTRDGARPPLRSVADIERERSERAATQAREVTDLVERARRARDEGKPGVASVYYQMASRRADDALRRRIDAEARQVSRTRAAAATQPTGNQSTGNQSNATQPAGGAATAR